MLQLHGMAHVWRTPALVGQRGSWRRRRRSSRTSDGRTATVVVVDRLRARHGRRRGVFPGDGLPGGTGRARGGRARLNLAIFPVYVSVCEIFGRVVRAAGVCDAPCWRLPQESLLPLRRAARPGASPAPPPPRAHDSPRRRRRAAATQPAPLRAPHSVRTTLAAPVASLRRATCPTIMAPRAKRTARRRSSTRHGGGDAKGYCRAPGRARGPTRRPMHVAPCSTPASARLYSHRAPRVIMFSVTSSIFVPGRGVAGGPAGSPLARAGCQAGRGSVRRPIMSGLRPPRRRVSVERPVSKRLSYLSKRQRKAPAQVSPRSSAFKS